MNRKVLIRLVFVCFAFLLYAFHFGTGMTEPLSIVKAPATGTSDSTTDRPVKDPPLSIIDSTQLLTYDVTLVAGTTTVPIPTTTTEVPTTISIKATGKEPAPDVVRTEAPTAAQCEGSFDFGRIISSAFACDSSPGLEARHDRAKNSVGTASQRAIDAFVSSGKVSASSGSQQPSGKCGSNSEAECSVLNNCLATDEGVCYEAPEKVTDLSGSLRTKLSVEEKNGGLSLPREGPSSELVCSWQPPADPLPTLKPNTDFAVSPEGRKIQSRGSFLQDWDNFMSVTGLSFENWYSIPPSSSDGSPDDNSSTGIRSIDKDDPAADFGLDWENHTDPSEQFRIKNLCVSPKGRLYGFRKPGENWTKIPAFKGRFEVPWMNHYAERVNDFLQGVVYFNESMSYAGPSWYVDRKLLINPLQDMTDRTHPGHTFMRSLGLIVNGEAAYGGSSTFSEEGQGKAEGEELLRRRRVQLKGEDWNEPRDDTTTMYLRHTGAGDGGKGVHDFKHALYTTLASKSHFFVDPFLTVDMVRAHHQQFASSSKNTNRSVPSLSDDEISRILDTPVCFREGVFYQACASSPGHEECYRERPGRHQWPLFGTRNPASQAIVAKRLRSCALANHKHAFETPAALPNICFSVRSHSRALLHNAITAGKLYWHIRESFSLATGGLGRGPSSKAIRESGGRFSILEQGRLTVFQVIQIYADIDILLGPYGSSLLYSVVSPARGTTIGVELSAGGITVNGLASGVNALPGNDYPSQFIAGGQYHMVQAGNESTDRYPSERLAYPPELTVRALVRAMCYYRVEASINPPRRSDPSDPRLSECNFDGLETARFFSSEAADEDGLAFRRIVRGYLNEEILQKNRNSSLALVHYRLLSLFERSASRILATQLHQLRTVEAKDRRLLLAFECPFAERDESQERLRFAEAILSELRIWRLVVTSQVHIDVVLGSSSPAAGKGQVPGWCHNETAIEIWQRLLDDEFAISALSVSRSPHRTATAVFCGFSSSRPELGNFSNSSKISERCSKRGHLAVVDASLLSSGGTDSFRNWLESSYITAPLSKKRKRRRRKLNQEVRG